MDNWTQEFQPMICYIGIISNFEDQTIKIAFTDQCTFVLDRRCFDFVSYFVYLGCLSGEFI